MTVRASCPGRTALSFLVALLWLLLPGVAMAAGEPAPVVLDVRVAFDGPDVAALRQATTEQVGAQLESLGHELVSDAPTHIQVAIEWTDDEQTAYAVTVTARKHGEIIRRKSETCEICGTPELFDLITASVEDTAKDIPSLPDEEPEAVTAPATDIALTEQHPRPRRVTMLGWSGVGIACAGVVVGAIGASVWSKGEERQVDPQDERQLVVTDYRPIGITVSVTGAVLTVGGITLLAVDAARGARRRVHATAALGSGGAPSVLITGRF